MVSRLQADMAAAIGAAVPAAGCPQHLRCNWALGHLSKASLPTLICLQSLSVILPTLLANPLAAGGSAAPSRLWPAAL